MFRSLFILFLVIPLIEIYFLIQVGKVIGAGWTIFAVVATAVIGAWLLRLQGFNTLQRAQVSIAQGQIPAIAMLEGVALVMSGALLLTPGFFTDTIGFLLLIPAVRQALIKRAFRNGQFVFRGQTMHSYHAHDKSSRETTIIEGELVDDENRHLK
ncbi:MAG: FxsA family protein [Gammaproteobacteria bacterium]|nr:FxsA family protein [Gammaproteobacteria bacterium]MDT8371015.1 FxsA family protein [Gammaproteobacteria bacterium]